MIDYQNDVQEFIEKFQNNPKVIFFKSLPTFKDTLKECVSKKVVDKNYNCDVSKEYLLKKNFEVNLMLRNLISKNKGKYYLFNLNNLICPNKNCNFFYKNGQSWIVDKFHANPVTMSDFKIIDYFKNYMDKIK